MHDYPITVILITLVASFILLVYSIEIKYEVNYPFIQEKHYLGRFCFRTIKYQVRRYGSTKVINKDTGEYVSDELERILFSFIEIETTSSKP